MNVFKCTSLLILVFTLLQPSSVLSQTQNEILKTKIGTVSFDKSITGFQFAAIMKERYVYSLNGKKDVTKATPQTGFLIEANQNMNYESAVDYVMELSNQFGQSNPDKMMTTLKDTIFNIQGHKSFCSRFSVFDKSGKKQCSMLIGVVPVNDNTVLFMSTDYSNDQYKAKFFSTFQSIRF